MNIIRQAQQVIAQRGHVKHVMETGGGSVCVAGALCVAKYGTGLNWTSDLEDPLRIISEVAQEQYPERCGGIHPAVRFNNHPDTTIEEVLYVMDKAAVRMDEIV